MLHNMKESSVPSLHISNIVDTIGAGDNFNAGFIHAYLNGKDPGDCLEEGNRTAAVSTLAPGGVEGIISYQQVLDKAKKLIKS